MPIALTYLTLLLCIIFTSTLLIVALRKKLVIQKTDTLDLLHSIIGVILITRPLSLWTNIQLINFLYHRPDNVHLIALWFLPLIYWILLFITFMVDALLISWAMCYPLKQCFKVSALLQLASVLGAFLFPILL